MFFVDRVYVTAAVVADAATDGSSDVYPVMVLPLMVYALLLARLVMLQDDPTAAEQLPTDVESRYAVSVTFPEGLVENLLFWSENESVTVTVFVDMVYVTVADVADAATDGSFDVYPVTALPLMVYALLLARLVILQDEPTAAAQLPTDVVPRYAVSVTFPDGLVENLLF